ncbi:MAG TPA: hypothetical protein VHN79_00580, partial [Lacunisphaera sp.]|nr:hypothetical protein [Lacunisphaera sp.]
DPISRCRVGSLWPGIVRGSWRWLAAGAIAFGLLASAALAETAGGDFGKDIQLAPFVVNGSPLSVSIHARTKGDRRYAEKFADEVVEVAYETLEDSTGKGLVIVGAKGEPHPVVVMRKFQAMAAAGQLDPSMTEVIGEVAIRLDKLKDKLKVDEGPSQQTGITFETFMPALPVPLGGVASKLYQLAWAEKFDDARLERLFRSLKPADLARGELDRYDWVFYLPPHAATGPVLKEVMDKGMKAEEMGLFKRAAIRSAVFAFKPVINKAVEGMRKGMLFRSVLDAGKKYSEEDNEFLTRAYVREIMPDLKPGSGDERRRALAAVEKQKLANAEYAKDPFMTPGRLAIYDATAYDAFLGEYSLEPPQATHWFRREGDSFQWNYKTDRPRAFHPAGERLLVNDDGTMTIQFIVDETGAVTAVEERWVRRRQLVARKG